MAPIRQSIRLVVPPTHLAIGKVAGSRGGSGNSSKKLTSSSSWLPAISSNQDGTVADPAFRGIPTQSNSLAKTVVPPELCKRPPACGWTTRDAPRESKISTATGPYRSETATALRCTASSSSTDTPASSKTDLRGNGQGGSQGAELNGGGYPTNLTDPLPLRPRPAIGGRVSVNVVEFVSPS